MSKYDDCSHCGGPKRATSSRCAHCREADTARPPQAEKDAWIEAIAQAIASEADDRGAFVVVFPRPLGEAQERLMRSLGVTTRTAT